MKPGYHQRPVGVYRCYTTCQLLLWVGKSVNPRSRLQHHAAVGAWWRPAVAWVTIEWFEKTVTEGWVSHVPGTRADECEGLAIAYEKPLGNRQLQCLPWREGAFSPGRERHGQLPADLAQLSQRLDVAPPGDRREEFTLTPLASLTFVAHATYPVRARLAPGVPRVTRGVATTA